MSVERLGIADAAWGLARRFAERHPSQARRILGQPPIYLPFVKREAATIVKAPQDAPKSGGISPELQAEIAAYVALKVEEIIAEKRKQVLLSVAPIDLSVRPTVKQIVEVVAILADIPASEFTSPRRARRLAWPRMIAMTLVRQALPSLSYPQIGKCFGNRDHTTVMHALKKTEWHIERDGEMAQLYRRARATIETKWPEAFK